MAKYRFSHWADDISKTNPTRTVNVTGDVTYTAVYVEVPTYTLTIQTPEYGTTEPVPASYTVNEGEAMTITAKPNDNYHLDHWEFNGANVGSANPYTTPQITQNSTLLAVFAYGKQAEFPIWLVVIVGIGAGAYYLWERAKKK